MDDAASEARRLRSSAMFNNRYFAECAAHVVAVSNGGQDMITVRQVAARSGLADSLVRPVLLRLAEARVLEKLPRMGGGRSPQYYRVLDLELLRWASLSQSAADRSTRSP
ncbi:MAG: hypothetical protein ACRCYU_18485 [Nocardioides sp.]